MTTIAHTSASASWQQQLIDAVRDPAELLDLLQLPQSLLEGARAASRDFALKVPRAYVRRMRRGDRDDPLLRQVLPLEEELQVAAGFSLDPLAEQHSNPHSGLVHKYHGRVLLIAAPNCAVNCRYCFRRHFPYQANNPGREQWQAVFDQLRADSSISEVIYSGGDPLAAPDRHLAWLTGQIAAIPHIRRLRVHTRLPVVIPARINDDALTWLSGNRLQPVLVLHSNHANELDGDVAAAVTRLRSAGVTVLNQAVLLRGVNDTTASLAQLSERLFEIGALPYYLHLLDRVQGAAHFALPDAHARQLYRELQARLPGYLVPRLVREEAGADSKTLVL